MNEASARLLYRYTVWFLARGQDWDWAEIWASDSEAAISEAIMQGYRHAPRCGPDDWSAVKLPDGRVLSRAEWEREHAA